LFFVGIDDTDVIDSPGTGRLARRLAELFSQCGAAVRGVTRHQLLVDGRIRYTSHNSSACLHVLRAGPLGPEGLWDRAKTFVSEHSAEGADPALCMAETPQKTASAALERFGRRAQREVLRPDDARRVAGETGVRLVSLAGSGEGVIGALSAVALAAGGTDGRFIELGRIRDLGEHAAVEEVLAAGVDAVVDGRRNPVDSKLILRTDGWVRPELLAHKAVLVVEKNDEGVWEAVNLLQRRRRKADARRVD